MKAHWKLVTAAFAGFGLVAVYNDHAQAAELPVCNGPARIQCGAPVLPKPTNPNPICHNGARILCLPGKSVKVVSPYKAKLVTGRG